MTLDYEKWCCEALKELGPSDTDELVDWVRDEKHPDKPLIQDRIPVVREDVETELKESDCFARDGVGQWVLTKNSRRHLA